MVSGGCFLVKLYEVSQTKLRLFLQIKDYDVTCQESHFFVVSKFIPLNHIMTLTLPEGDPSYIRKRFILAACHKHRNQVYVTTHVRLKTNHTSGPKHDAPAHNMGFSLMHSLHQRKPKQHETLRALFLIL